jgi:hypothetical protein
VVFPESLPIRNKHKISFRCLSSVARSLALCLSAAVACETNIMEVPGIVLVMGKESVAAVAVALPGPEDW